MPTPTFKPARPAARIQGKGIGQGRGSSTPTLPKIKEIPVPPSIQAMIAQGAIQPGTRAFRMGRCLILVSPPFGSLGWHLSISRPDRYPSWDEVAHARCTLVPDGAVMAMLLPPRAEYVNMHDLCFHLHQIDVQIHPEGQATADRTPAT